MATELISLGTTATTSGDFTVSAGGSAHIHLKSATPPGIPPCTVSIDVKSGSDYFEIHRLTEENPSAVVSATGTYRVRRALCDQSVGVDQD